MKKSNSCPKCGSAEIVRDVEVRRPKGPIFLAKEADPTAFVLKEPQESGLRGWVCGACGYVEFYADDPGVLLNAQKQGDLRIAELK